MTRPPSDATLAKYLPKGPCLGCRRPTYLAAHMYIDMIRYWHRLGNSIASLARDYSMPRSVVTWLATAPIGKLRKWRRTR